MEKRVLVSACLLGLCCRYDGQCRADEAVRREAAARGWIPVCPEILGGLTTPRAPAERRDGRVATRDGGDVTEAFRRGAEEALKLAKLYGAEYALLKERSPSCGTDGVYDGTFTGNLVPGEGVAASLFRSAGLRAYGESSLEALIEALEQGEKDDTV